jgi:hypothetical protein
MAGPAASPSPAQAQRLVAAAILLGAAAFAVIVPILLQANDGRGYAEAAVPRLDWIATGTAAVLAVAAVSMRTTMLGRAEALEPPQRDTARLQATLVVLALLEGGMLFSCVTWLLNGTAVPNAVAAGALFALAIVLLPRSQTV